MREEEIQHYPNEGSNKSKQRNIKEDFLMIMSKLPILQKHKMYVVNTNGCYK